jgi:hypothetical protein
MTVLPRGCSCRGTAPPPELCRNTPTSWWETGLEENTVLGSARAVLEVDSIGSSSSPSAASMFSRFSSRLGSGSGMMVGGLGGVTMRYVGGCIACTTSWVGRSPVVRTVRRVEGCTAAGEGLLTTTVFCFAACWALARAAISSSCSATGVRGCRWPGWYRLICLDRSPL